MCINVNTFIKKINEIFKRQLRIKFHEKYRYEQYFCKQKIAFRYNT